MDLSLSSEFASILNGKNVYCGFSGGADSLTLLLLLSEAEEAFHFTLHAVHFEHGLRGRAGEDDARFCCQFCKSRNIPFTCISLNVPENISPGEGIEAAARRLRMNHWKMLPKNSVVALGHNSDDFIENLFLRLMRGSNVSGLTSLSQFTENNDIAIIRPLLSTSRNSIESFLKGRGLEWRTDATNLESDYGRNFLRNQILPSLYEKFPYGKDGLLRSLNNLHSDAEYLDHQAQIIFKSMNPALVSNWKNLPQAILCRVFRLFLSEKTGKNVIIGHHLLSRFENLIAKPQGQGYAELQFPDLPDFSLFIGTENLFLVDHRKADSISWNPENNEKIEFLSYRFQIEKNPVGKGNGVENAAFDALSLPLPLIIRQINPGDKITAFGRNTSESVKKYLSESGIPAPLRESYPVLCDAAGEIIWIPGVKRSNKYPARNSDFIFISFHNHEN